ASEEAPLRAAADRLGDLPLEVGRGRRAVQAGQGAPGLLQLGQRLLAPGAVLEVPLDRAGLVRRQRAVEVVGQAGLDPLVVRVGRLVRRAHRGLTYALAASCAAPYGRGEAGT